MKNRINPNLNKQMRMINRRNSIKNKVVKNSWKYRQRYKNS